MKMRLFFFLLLIFALVVGCSRMERPVSVQHSCNYMAGGNTTYLSFKGLKEYSGDLVEIRKTEAPIISTVNFYLTAIEYQVKHNLTRQDFDELLGDDFSIQMEPQFLLISRCRKEFNVFFYLDTNPDPVIQSKPYMIKAKEVLILKKKIYYAFAHGFFFASDDLHLLKRSIHRLPSGNKKVSNAARFIIHDGRKNGIFHLFFSGGAFDIWGNNANALSFIGNFKQNSSSFDENNLVWCNVRITDWAKLKKTVYGKFMLKDISVNKNILAMGYQFFSPLDLKSADQHAVEAQVLADLHNKSSSLTKRRVGNYLMYANLLTPPIMRDDGILFHAEVERLADLPIFPKELSILFKEIGSINVRKAK